jgi:NAD(P)-dependent dehydrogenase (short-subunit alcohol dehydrogenase family)
MSTSRSEAGGQAPSPRQPARDKVIVITGASSGVGLETARQLAGQGGEIVMIVRDQARGEHARSQVAEAAAGKPPVLLTADLSVQADIRRVAHQVRDRYDHADILINNAGISGPVGPLWQAQTAEWWRAIEVNLGGAFVLTQLALEHMIPAGKGRIINVTSYAGVYRWPLLSAYAASKAALVKLTETLAEETRPHGVSVFSVDPGLLPIGLGQAALRASAGRETPAGRVQRWIRDQLAAGRGADPEEAARLIIALASGRADRLSGRHLSVNDNLDALLPRIDQIERDDLHTLRLRTGH